MTPGFHLAALDPDTGRPVPGFGENGIVDLMIGVRGEVNDKSSIGNSSPPTIVGDVVIVGPAHEVGMRPPSKANLKGDVRGYDVRTGKLLWTFHTIPQRGEPGYETWLNGSAEYIGNAGVWAPMTADAELGYVYLPTEAPIADTWGGERHGNNLYSSSLVCLDAKTGERVWHYQLIHHDIWDWDNPTAPILDGSRRRRPADQSRRAAHEAGVRLHVRPRHGRARVADRGAARAADRRAGRVDFADAAVSDEAAGVRSSGRLRSTTSSTSRRRCAPKPSKASKAFRIGPIFTPPSLANASDGTSGTLMLPNATGGANWEGGAFDPETNVLYVGSYTNPFVLVLEPPPAGSDITYINGGGAQLPWLQGLPLIKPPWGRITAIDMNKGEHLWQVASGPTPKEIAENPALKGLDIPPTGRATRPVTLVTKTLLFTAEGWGGAPTLHARDKATGAIVAEIALPGAVGGRPMTYMIDGKQYLIVSVAGGNGAEIVALTL